MGTGGLKEKTIPQSVRGERRRNKIEAKSCENGAGIKWKDKGDAGGGKWVLERGKKV